MDFNTNWYYPRTFYFVARDSGLTFVICVSYWLFQDSESRSPIHIAITSKHPIVTRLLLSHPELNMNVTDRSGQTPFAVALRTRDHEAAGAILAREPGAAEQVIL